MSISLKGRAVVALVAVLVAAPLAACTSKKAANAGSSTSTSTSTSPVKVLIGASGIFTDLGFVVAQQLGYFAQEGIELQSLPPISNPSLIYAALLSGQADITTSSLSGLWNVRAAGKDIVAVVENQSPSMSIVLNKATIQKLASQGITPTSPLADRIKALKGLSLAIPAAGSGTNNVFRGVLIANGLNPDKDVTLRSTSDNTATYDLARQNQTDGLVLAEPQISEGLSEGWATMWVNVAKEVPQVNGIGFASFQASNAWVKAHPDIVRRFDLAVLKGDAFLNNPANADAIKAKLRNVNGSASLSQAVYDTAFTNAVPAYAAGGIITADSYNRSQQFFNTVLKKKIDQPYEQVYAVGPLQAAAADLKQGK
jgi:NitT/TauT family transport system substrate-binding protein